MRRVRRATGAQPRSEKQSVPVLRPGPRGRHELARGDAGWSPYSQGTESVMPTEGKNFLQSVLLAEVSSLAVLIDLVGAVALATTSAEAIEIEEFSLSALARSGATTGLSSALAIEVSVAFLVTRTGAFSSRSLSLIHIS